MAKILLVDDAAFMRMMVKNSLTKGGFADCTFVEAQDGMEAVKMPNMDGLQALKKIREAHPDAKVVMCTAMGQESMVVDAIKSGAKDFVVKPFNAERITSTVKNILG